MRGIALPETKSRCIEHLNGTKWWYLDDKYHRVNGPAVEYPDGTKVWFINGKHHRVDGPAIEKSNGTKIWYLDGKIHRLDGPAIEHSDGTKEWHIDGKCHRINGPAYDDPDGTKMWYINDMLHRIDGPAIEWPSGNKDWYLDGRDLEEFEYFALLKIRKFRSKIIRFNNALESKLGIALNLSRSRAIVEWYYSPDNGGGKVAKTRLEGIINGVCYFRSD